jgi:hypothetical protein
MTHPIFHAESSVRRFGGSVEDYQPIHDWLDATKETFCDFRHRALRHHAQGVFEAERVFGTTIRNSEGRLIPTRYIAEQHETWMSRGYPLPVEDPAVRDV